MYSDDEKKVIEYSQKALEKRAEFFNEAAKRHPALARNFNELAEATRDMAKLVYVPAGEEDRLLVDSIATRYAPNLREIAQAAAKKPALMEELKESQRILQEELAAFDTRHPELVPARDALNKKNAPKP